MIAIIEFLTELFFFKQERLAYSGDCLIFLSIHLLSRLLGLLPVSDANFIGAHLLGFEPELS